MFNFDNFPRELINLATPHEQKIFYLLFLSNFEGFEGKTSSYVEINLKFHRLAIN